MTTHFNSICGLSLAYTRTSLIRNSYYRGADRRHHYNLPRRAGWDQHLESGTKARTMLEVLLQRRIFFLVCVNTLRKRDWKDRDNREPTHLHLAGMGKGNGATWQRTSSRYSIVSPKPSRQRFGTRLYCSSLRNTLLSLIGLKIGWGLIQVVEPL